MIMTKHYAQVLGKVLVKKYKVSFGEVSGSYETLETPVIWEGELESPILNCSDKIYLENIKEELEIKKVVRSTDGTYLYYTNHQNGKIVENEITEKSRLEAEEKLNSEKNNDDSSKDFHNIETKKVLKEHLIQLQLFNTYEKCDSARDMHFILNTIDNLSVISEWSNEYQEILNKKLDEIQKYIISKIQYNLSYCCFHEVNQWSSALVYINKLY